MAWPSEAGAILITRGPARSTPVLRLRSRVCGPVPMRRRRPASRVFEPVPFRRRWHIGFSALYRIYNDAEYRFYRSKERPPRPGDAPFATSSSLPHTPTETYADGTWMLSVSWFNGLLDSGFLSIGPSGETYLRLDIESSEAVAAPPRRPIDWRLQPMAAGVVRVIGLYHEPGALRADQWALGYTTNGSDPPEDTPDVTKNLSRTGLQILSYDLPAQVDETEVRVRLQTRRNDGSDETPNWTYSEGSVVKSATAVTD